MNFFLILLILVLLAVGGLAVWMRVMPESPDRYHAWPAGQSKREWSEAGGYGRVVSVTGPEAFAAFDQILRAAPRTEWAKGSVEAGRVTYIARSLVFGFPDYVTVEYRTAGPEIAIYSRLRVGRSDLGVNKARVLGWLAELRDKGMLVQP